jgi:hypothetical protein
MSMKDDIAAGQTALDLAPDDLLPPDGARVTMWVPDVTQRYLSRGDLMGEIRTSANPKVGGIYSIKVTLCRPPDSSAGWSSDQRICTDFDLYPGTRFTIHKLPKDVPPIEAWPRVSTMFGDWLRYEEER